MKIAVLGSASSSLPNAPFKDTTYEQWVQGKMPAVARAHAQVGGDWNIWGCSPGCWAVIPRATRWFEVHRWEPGKEWFSPEYCQFLRDFKGIVYTGGVVPEITNHVVFPIDYLEEKFSSYFMTSSLALMMAEAIDTIEKIRAARGARDVSLLPAGVDPAELDKDDNDDVIGMWGVDMAAGDEYAYQRPGCQFFVLEAMRRGIGVFLPPESDLMRPMPVYGVSEWDHNYIKLTSRARELNAKAQFMQKQFAEAQTQIAGLQGEQHALQYFVSTWTSQYGMLAGMVIRQAEGTGLGSGITTFDGRPVERMGLGEDPAKRVIDAMSTSPDAQLGRQLLDVLGQRARHYQQPVDDPQAMLARVFNEANVGIEQTKILQGYAQAGETTATTLRRLISELDAALRPKRKAKPRR